MLDFDITPAQYHAGLDKLWAALDYPPMTDEDVFTRAARAIGRSPLELAAPKLLEACQAADHALSIADQQSVDDGLCIWHRLSPRVVVELRIELRAAIAEATPENDARPDDLGV